MGSMLYKMRSLFILFFVSLVLVITSTAIRSDDTINTPETNNFRTQIRPQRGGATRIVLGEPTSTKHYPFVVSLQAQSEDYYDYHFCGASILRAEKPAILLTAAHCLDMDQPGKEQFSNMAEYLEYGTGSPWTLFAVVGKDDVIQSDGTSDGIYWQTPWHSYRMHGHYNQHGKTENDIALILLDDSIPEHYGQPITLNTLQPCCANEEKLEVIGYGARDNGEDPTSTLEMTEVKYVPMDECERHHDLFFFLDQRTDIDPLTVDWDRFNWSIYDQNQHDMDHFILDGMLCAFDPFKDSCQGDSGGPLVKYHWDQHGKNRMKKHISQIGIVSFGFGCADGLPGVYTDVGWHREWIQHGQSCLMLEYWKNKKDTLNKDQLNDLRIDCAKLSRIDGTNETNNIVLGFEDDGAGEGGSEETEDGIDGSEDDSSSGLSVKMCVVCFILSTLYL